MKKWKSFSDWRLRTKLFFILALCLVVSMLLSVYNMFHISRAYDRELYGALSNFLSLSVTEIGYKLDNVQQMTTDLGQDSQIQTYLSHNLSLIHISYSPSMEPETRLWFSAAKALAQSFTQPTVGMIQSSLRTPTRPSARR